MALFPLFKKGKKELVHGSTFTPSFIPLEIVQQLISGSLDANDTKLLKYYLSVPELQSVINYRAKLFASMMVKIQNTKTGDIFDKHEILDFLEQPNVLQDFTEWANQASVLKDIFGNGFIHNLKGVLKTAALFNLPAGNAEIIPVSENVNIFNQTDVNKIIKQYQFRYGNGKITYEPDAIIHSNDTQVRFDLQTKGYLKGQSRIQPLTQACENIITAYKARGILQGNSPVGIIANRSKDGMGTATMDPKEKEGVQDNLKQYGLTDKKYQFIVTGMDLNYVSMSTNVKQLMLFEEVEADQRAIGNAFSFNVDLFLGNNTFENQKEADKQMYQNATIPDAKAWLKQLSKGLGLLDKNLLLIPDFTHIPALQDDLEKRSKIWFNATRSLHTAWEDGALSDEEYKENLKKIGML